MEGSVLRRIFGFLSRSENLANAQVCRLWCEAALNELWEEVDATVFEMLGEMKLRTSAVEADPPAWVISFSLLRS